MQETFKLTLIALDIILIAEERACSRPTETACANEFFELAPLIMKERHVEVPKISEEAVILYSILTDDMIINIKMHKGPKRPRFQRIYRTKFCFPGARKSVFDCLHFQDSL